MWGYQSSIWQALASRSPCVYMFRIFNICNIFSRKLENNIHFDANNLLKLIIVNWYQMTLMSWSEKITVCKEVNTELCQCANNTIKCDARQELCTVVSSDGDHISVNGYCHVYILFQPVPPEAPTLYMSGSMPTQVTLTLV